MDIYNCPYVEAGDGTGTLIPEPTNTPNHTPPQSPRPVRARPNPKGRVRLDTGIGVTNGVPEKNTHIEKEGEGNPLHEMEGASDREGERKGFEK